MTPSPIEAGGLLPVPQPPAPANDPPTPAPSGTTAAAGAPRLVPPTVAVSLSSVDPPVVAEYAELTPGSTGPVVTALSEDRLLSELRAQRAFSARAEIAADDGGAAPRFEELA